MSDSGASLDAQAAGPRSVTTLQDEVGRQAQALADLSSCEAVSISLVHCPTPAREQSLIKQLAATARSRGFVTVEVSLLEVSLDTFADLVRAIITGLTAPSESRPCGLLYLLELFSEARGRRAEATFHDGAEFFGADGDLTALCQAYLAADDEADNEIRAFEAWLNGTEPGRRARNPRVRRALSNRTAQRAFNELTRVIRALGHNGLAVYLYGGDAIAKRTERQRETAYTVLRELVDNFDGGKGALSTRILLTGTERLFEGERSLASLEPLLMRLTIPSDAEPPPPHRSWTSLIRDPYEYVHRKVGPGPDKKLAAMRNLIRIAQGLPPTEAVTSMSVGHDRIDRTIEKLFEHIANAGSVFSILAGEYGSGKTHLLMHFAERALKERHPVFWLNLERMNLDLGNPQRHLSRLLESSVLPLRRRPSAAERASVWTRSNAKLRALTAVLHEIAGVDGEEAHAAQKALKVIEHARDPGHAVENFLLGRDIENKPASSSYRLDAYRRIILWIELLKRLDGLTGPVFLIDEAENLYTTGRSRSARRTALRSLSFYCGGALPGACVMLAMTPPALKELKREARELLGEVGEQETTLELEDATLFRRRLSKLEPEPVPGFSRRQREELAEHVRRTHRAVRGDVSYEEWDAVMRRLAREIPSPRVLIRSLVDELEARWWAGDRA